MNVADTVVFGIAETPIFISTSKTGYVYRSNDPKPERILQKFQTQQETDIACVLKKDDPENANSNTSQPLTHSDLNKLLQKQPPGIFCLQRYVSGPTSHATMMRVLWKADGVGAGWILTNQRRTDNAREKGDPALKYLTSTRDSAGCDIFPLSCMFLYEYWFV